jgi:hypothetical protein
MSLIRWVLLVSLWVGIGSAGAALLSCGTVRGGTGSELHSDGDYPRDPGSFCALNPEGCPPDPRAAQLGPGVFDLDGCLKACEAGGAVLESYCRGLSETWQQRLCWSVVLGSKVACRGMCYRLHDCATSTSCPERDK